MPDALKRLSYLSLATLLSFGVSACGGGGGSDSNITTTPVLVDTGPELLSDIEYKQGATNSGNIPLALDIYQSSNLCGANRPVVLYVHGGGFTTGSKTSEEVALFAEGLNARNIDLVSINYRLIGDEPILSPAFQAAADDFTQQVLLGISRNAIFAAKEDTVDALLWMETNADAYCLNTNRLAIAGASAGAITVLRVAYGLNDYGINRPEPAAVVNIFGTLIDMEDLEFREAPFITLHGQQDPLVPYQESEDLAARADDVGVPYSYYLVADGGHDETTLLHDYQGAPLTEKMYDFVEAHIVGGVPSYESVVVE